MKLESNTLRGKNIFYQVLVVSLLLVINPLMVFGEEFILNHKINNNSTSNSVSLKSGVINNEKEIEREIKKRSKLEGKNSYKKRKESRDNLGVMHTLYEQRYNGVLVEGGEVTVHNNSKSGTKITGKALKNILLNTNPSLTKNAALDAALMLLPSQEYVWESKDVAKRMKARGRSVNSIFPKPELIIIKDPDGNGYKLAYKIDISSLRPLFGYSIYIDAHTGEELIKIPSIHHAAQASGATLYDGTQYFYTSYDSGLSTYKLFDDDLDIVTYFDWSLPTDSNNVWSSSSQRKFVSAHWASSQTYNYYFENFGRDSYDDNGTQMILNVNSSVLDNAYWYPSLEEVHIGNGNTNASNWLSSLDIVGHEWTHALTTFTANLIYSGESGALNESFSDIFGTMIEFYSSSGNYDLGEDMWIADGKLRSLSNPKSKNKPDTYLGEYWSSTGAVHTNSSVQNHWFYLLAEGGQGVNDNNDSYILTGIGRDKAAEIAYRNLTVYLNRYSNYWEARIFSIEAAEDLYGENSIEVARVTDAWYAVGVGPKYSGTVYREEVESNNSSSTADGPANLNTFFEGNLSTSSDSDWYYFEAPASGNITITTFGAYKGWTLYNSSLVALTSGYTSSTPHGYRGTKTYNLSSAGRYYLKYTGYSGNYYFGVSGNVSTAAFFEIESNSSGSSANGPIGPNRTISGSIGSSSDNDWYMFDAESAGMIIITLNGAYKSWTLYNSPTGSSLTTGYAGSKSYNIPNAGRYYLKLSGYGGRYDFSIDGNITPAVYEIEQNNSWNFANNIISSGVTVGGKINSGTDNDYFSFAVQQPGSVTINLEGDYKSLTIYDSSYSQIFHKYDGTSQYYFSAAGDYYVRIQGYSGIYDFQLTGAFLQ